MPANLSPDYMKAEREYRSAKAPEDRLACLERMLSLIPKHKGTDKMQGDLKRRIAKQRDGLDKQARKKGPSYRVRPEGAGQLMLVGPPNSGKSSILAALTHAQPEIADYPCTTREPVPGMLHFEEAQIQLVDLPPLWREHCEIFVYDNIKVSDGAIVVLDVTSSDPLSDFNETINLLADRKICLVPTQNATLRRDELEYLLVLNKADLDTDGELVSQASEMLADVPQAHVVSAKDRTGLDDLASALFAMLHVIRVYSKEPGKKSDQTAPYTVPAESTVMEFAAHVHKDFAAEFKGARVWGSAKFAGQVVQRDHILQDRDIVELAKR